MHAKGHGQGSFRETGGSLFRLWPFLFMVKKAKLPLEIRGARKV